MRQNKKAKCLISGLLVLLLFTGCSSHALDELYTLPKQSDAYVDLQKTIDEVMAAGAMYCGPMSGTNQQPVQLVDLDDDGEDEAVVFLKTGGDQPLKAYIFAKRDDKYINVDLIEGDGAGFDTVEYAQLDGEPGLEIVIGLRLNGQMLKSLSAYTYRAGQVINIAECRYSDFRVSDLDNDAKKDIVVLRLDGEEHGGTAELYRWKDGRMLCEHMASMSVGAKQIKRITEGKLEGNIPAIFVASAYEENAIITDVFTVVDGVFKNVAFADQLGLNGRVVHHHNVYATDIDADGIVELPLLRLLPSYTAGEETQWVIDWYGLTAQGDLKPKMTTYHNYSDGWFLNLPMHWSDQITVCVNSDNLGTTIYTVSKWIDYDNEPQKIFAIYAITGKTNAAQAQENGKFLLAEKGDTVYAASLGECDLAQTLSQKDLISMFRFVYMDWNET